MSHSAKSCTWVEGLCLWRPLSFRFLLDPVSLERPKPLLTRDSLDCVVGTKASPRLMHFFSWAANKELGNCTIHPAFIRPWVFHVLVTITTISPWSTTPLLELQHPVHKHSRRQWLQCNTRNEIRKIGPYSRNMNMPIAVQGQGCSSSYLLLSPCKCSCRRADTENPAA